MQTQLLARNPDAKLHVYALWTNKLFGDSRARWDAAGMTDPRVVHLWDGDDLAGQWLAEHVDGYQGPDWDTWLLFGPDATWTTAPGPLRDWGSPVIDTHQDLTRTITPLLSRG